MNFRTRINHVALYLNRQGRFRKYLTIASAVFTLAAAGTLMNATRTVARAGGPPEPGNGPSVTIDPTQLPLPVTGSVGVSGTVSAKQSGPWAVAASQTGPWTVASSQSGTWTMSANQSGPWNVGLVGTPTFGLAPGATVTVANSNTQPVQTVDVEKLARIPYQSTYRTTTCVNVTNCFFQFTAAPSGYRLVVEHISGIFELSNTATAPVTGLIEGSNFLNTFGFTSSQGQIFNGTIMSGLNQPARMVFDSSEGNPVAFVYGDYPSIQGLPSFITLDGYLENCSVTSCPTIQR